MGKTALAVQWAHRVTDRFPDGQLYVNLRGFDPAGTPVAPAEAIRGFLEALGVPSSQVPAGGQERAALYRSRLAGRRMLVLLDNARDPDQVRPLLPGTGGCVAVVTSRHQLAGLVAHDGAHLFNLGMLSTGEASLLLAAYLGHDRVAAEPQAVAEIVQRCERLPLALSIVAARAAVHPTFRLATLAAELGDVRGRLDALAGDSPVTDVRAVFAWSYQTLTPDAARMFRLLGLHAGPDVSIDAAASAAGLPPARAKTLLAELARVHLLVEHAPGRFTFHDLLRAYATETVASEEPQTERREATARMLDHYLHNSIEAAYRINPHRAGWHPERAAALPGVVSTPAEDVGQALNWFATEIDALLSVFRWAREAGHDAYLRGMAWALSGYLHRSGRIQEWVDTQRISLDVVERLGGRSELAWAHRGLARAYRKLGDLDRTRLHLGTALELFLELGDLAGEAHTHNSMGQAEEVQGRYARALHHAERSLELFRAIGDTPGEAAALNAVGWCLGQLGDHEQALARCTAALKLQQDCGDGYGEAGTLDSLGHIHQQLGDHARAVECGRLALELHRKAGDRLSEAEGLIQISAAYRALDDTDGAVESLRRAITILEDVGDPTAGHARSLLRDLTGPR